NDALVARAPAQVPGQALAYLLLARLRVSAEEPGHRDDEAGGAEPALQAMAVAEGLLYRAERPVLRGQPLNRGHLGALQLHREQQAGPYRVAVDEHRARAADAVLTPQVRAGEVQVLAQRVGQRLARFAPHPPALAVHGQLDVNLSHGQPPRS